MKKILLFLVISWALSPFLSMGQIPYHDALLLRELNPVNINGTLFFPLKDSMNKEAAKILKNYTNKSTYAGIEGTFSTNPFIRLPKDNSQSAQGNVKGISKKFISDLGGLDVTNLADGLARFMVKRMKEELNIMFFEEFNKQLDKQRDLQELFPSTWSILQTASKEIYSYQKFLPALREAFEYDLDEFLSNSYAWSINPNSDLPLLTELAGNPKLHNALKILFYSGAELDQGSHPGEILRTILSEDKIDFSKLHPKLKGALQVGNLFSQSLRSNNTDRYWISKAEAKQLAMDTTLLRIYFGLVYQQASKEDLLTVQISNGKKFEDILKEVAKAISSAKDIVEEFNGNFENVETALKKVQALEEMKGSDYMELARVTFKMAEAVVTNKVFPIEIESKEWEGSGFYINHASFLFANLESRAYSAAVYEAYAILNKVLEGSKNADKVLNPFLKYGSFMATVATAENSQEVADAIEAVALPTGSARIKREVAWNISLNSYLGGFYGKETIEANGESDKGSAAGVFAPVGIAFSRNFRICKANFSATLFGSIIDIGALASYRLDSENDDIEAVPEIKLENIISPGAYLILGLPRIPISLGIGYQIGPQLREVSADSNVILENQYERIAGFIAVDIPLMNFYSRSRKK